MSKGTVNKVILVGRLGKDPDMRYTPGGTAVVNFSMATNYSTKDQDGNFVDKTEWHRVVAYGRTAEVAGEYLQKGKLVYVEGRIQSRSWEDQNNQKRYVTEIVCSTMQLLGSRGEAEAKPEEEPEPEEEVKESDAEEKQDGEEENDLPF
jgi:single-strand DNA-binding protein